MFNEAKVYGLPGEWARVRGVMYALCPMVVAMFVVGLLLGLALPQMDASVVAGGLIIVALTLAWTVRYGLRRIDAFFKGARGEERVAMRLAFLPTGYSVFHDFKLPSGLQVDHVVLGPTGIFVVETKCWAGAVTSDADQIYINGQLPSRSPLHQVREASQEMTVYLTQVAGESVMCVPVVCFASNTFSQDAKRVDGMVVCNERVLESIITEADGRIATNVLERMATVMEQLYS